MNNYESVGKLIAVIIAAAWKLGFYGLIIAYLITHW